jgi:hypothetical protein
MGPALRTQFLKESVPYLVVARGTEVLFVRDRRIYFFSEVVNCIEFSSALLTRFEFHEPPSNATKMKMKMMRERSEINQTKNGNGG